MLSDTTVDAAVRAVRSLIARNRDMREVSALCILLRVLVDEATAEQRTRVEELVDQIRARWDYWAPDESSKLPRRRDTIPAPPPQCSVEAPCEACEAAT